MNSADAWEMLACKSVYDGSHLQVREVRMRTPSRVEGRRWTIAHRKQAVVIAAMTSDAKLVLIREERVPVQAALWSVPAGQIDDESGSAEVARRELKEETGYELGPGGELIPLGHFFTSPGFTDECCHLFLARPVELCADGAAHAESESILECAAFSASEIAQMIARNEIRDANTLSMCALLAARGYLSLGL